MAVRLQCKEWKDKMGPDGDKILAEYQKLKGM